MIIHGSIAKRSVFKDGKYVGNIDDNTRNQIDKIYEAGKIENLKHALTGFELEDFQTVLPAVAYMSKRFLIGADTGLGKSLMMSLYLKIHKEKGTLNSGSKALIVTTNSSLNQIKKVVESSTGIRVKFLPGDSNKLLEVLSNQDLENYDVYIVTNSVFGKSVDFARVFAYLRKQINIFVFDESMVAANPDSLTHNAIKHWIKDCEYRLFLNATVIEKKLEQPYYQFLLLEEDLLPNIEQLKKRYEVWQRTGRGRRSKSKMTGYKDLDKFLDSIPYHYKNVSRVELGRVFESEDILVPLMATPLQKTVESPQNYVYALFSPTTQQETSIIPFTPDDVPALGKTIEIVRNEYAQRKGGIVIYAEPTACKDVLYKHIKEAIPGIQVGIIDGQAVDRDYTREAFNRREIHVLIINIPEALDLTSGEVMIMYTIPSKHYQAKARIARGLNTDGSKKRYYYPVYLHSFQSRYIKTTLRQDEETLDNSQKRGITTARTLTATLNKLESTAIQGVMF